MKYLVIIPAYNEENTIASVIAETKEQIPDSDILVINDGSEDATLKAATAEGVTIVSHPFNLGYGAALQTGFRFAVKNGYDFIITMDADGQHNPSSARSLMDVMSESGADVVIGSRFTGQGYQVGILRKIGMILFSMIAKAYTGIGITDPTSGFQLISKNAFAYMAKGDNYPLDYPDVNIIMALHKSRFKIAEAPVVMRGNSDGKSMHNGLRPLLYVFKMFLAILMVLVRGRGR